MNLGKVLFIAILLFSGATILASSSLGEKMINDAMRADGTAEAMAELAAASALRQSYQNNLLENVNEYAAGHIAYDELQAKLLELKVPAEYKNLHFTLIASLDEMSERKKLDAVQKQLESLKNDYSWLAGALSLLIANLF